MDISLIGPSLYGDWLK